MDPSAGEAEKPSTRVGTLSCFAVSSRRKIRCGYAVGEKFKEIQKKAMKIEHVTAVRECAG
jgi:hypothetical protein